MSSGNRSRPLSLIESVPLFPGAPSYPPIDISIEQSNSNQDSRIIRSRPSSIVGGSNESIMRSSSNDRKDSQAGANFDRRQSNSNSNYYIQQQQQSQQLHYSQQPSIPYTTPLIQSPILPYQISQSPVQYSSSSPHSIITNLTNQVPLISTTSPSSQVQLQYHQQLVTYYLNYARQGRLAPVTDERQERARLEAVNWARSEGINISLPSTAISPVLSNHHPIVASPISNYSSPVQIQLPNSISPSTRFDSNTLPSYLNRSVSLATTPTNPILPPSNGLARSFSAAQSSTSASPTTSNPSNNIASKRPLPIPPPKRASTLPLNSVANTISANTISSNGVQGATIRPLPQPQVNSVERVSDQMNNLSMSSTSEANSRRNSIPIPSFSFGDEDNENSNPSISVGSTPSFNISTLTSSPSPIQPRLHPRLDPLHPSHYLYHPTSTNTSSTNSSQQQKKLTAGTITCARCNIQMFGRALMAMGKEWHPDCFSCAKDGCGEKLEFVQFEGNEEGEVFCMVHYEELYAAKCYQCKTPIAAEEYVTVSDPLLLPPGPRTYHALHFFCASCGDPFVDPKSLAKGKEGTLAAPFMVEKGFAYCQACDLRMFRPKCWGCKKGIGGEWAEVEGRMWHVDCFTCSRCEKPLTGPYLVRDDEQGSEGELPYCYECYDIKARS